MMKILKTGMTFNEFVAFQKDTGLTDDKLRTMTTDEIEDAIREYKVNKNLNPES